MAPFEPKFTNEIQQVTYFFFLIVPLLTVTDDVRRR